MEFIVLVLALVLLLIFGYVQLRRNVIKMPGDLNADLDEEWQSQRQRKHP
ncbi:MAG TPA: hypothetical protein PKE64_00020 [Anaerolineae bacterium]|nr:hypothetical protein [Anaerolineae bacterium]HMR62370.1 hypothetical protein [Anaerolineae bacterium]